MPIIPEIHVSKTKADALNSIREALHNELSSADHILVLFSGGSSLEILNDFAHIKNAAHVTLSIVDERNDPTKKTSNFEMFRQTPFVLDCVSKKASVIPFSVERSPADIEASFREWRQNHPNGRVLVFLGMGSDGHTAGIFPTNTPQEFEDLYENNSWVVSRNISIAPACPNRTSVTASFLIRETTRVFAFICGKEKLDTLRKSLETNAARHLLPAVLFQYIPNIDIFTDQDIS